MSYAKLTDDDIETLCYENDLSMRARERIYQQRETDRSLEAAFAAIEEEATDADKAEEFPPHACPFPTKAQLENAKQPRMVSLSIAVSTERLQGKTALLIMILDMLADAGALSVADTRYLTQNMGHYFNSKLCINDELVEVLELDLDLNVLYEMSKRAGR